MPSDVRAKVIGEGANLAHHPGRRGSSSPSRAGGSTPTSSTIRPGVDCSDNEVNIKIPLNREMREGRLTRGKRNALLAKMTDEVAELVLEDNRLQTLALSIAESGGARALPGYVRTIEMLEAAGRLDRKVEGLDSSEELLRRGAGGSRPDPARARGRAVDVQDRAAGRGRGAEARRRPDRSSRELFAAFPEADAQGRTPRRSARTACGTRSSPPRSPTGFVNRLGPSVALDMTEEEGASLGAGRRGLPGRRAPARPATSCGPRSSRRRCPRWSASNCSRSPRTSVRAHIADILRAAGGETSVDALVQDAGARPRARSPRSGKV